VLLIGIIAVAFVIGIELRQRQSVITTPDAAAPQPTSANQPATAPSPAETLPAASPSPTPPTTGMLKVTTVPAGAAVDLDGISVGQTPLTMTDVRAGKHTVKLTKAGFRTEGREIEITAGETLSLEVALSSSSRPAPRRRAPPLPPPPPAPLPPPPRP
jgi:hypothetical protein